jgi:hypothetical protein
VVVRLNINILIMSRLIYLLCFAFSTLYLTAQEVLLVDSLVVDSVEVDSVVAPSHPFILDAMPNAKVYQDSAITLLLEDKSYNRKRGEYQVSGFRVQVYSSNEPQVAKNEALELSELLSSQLHIGVYVNSEPPFWKVRLGDFLTREEANAFKLQVVKFFPELQGSTYIVPDLVTVNN